METVDKLVRRGIRQGLAMLGFGALLLVVGSALPRLAPGLSWNLKWVEGFGIVLLSFGLSRLTRYLIGARDPAALRRSINEERDERVVAINHQAGNAAFVFTILSVGAALIVYSALTRGQPYDALWLFMAAVVLGASIFYTAAQFYLRGKK